MERANLIRIEASLPWNCFKGDSGEWIGVCDALDLTVQAEIWGELMEDIGDTLNLMLQELLASNELEKFLQDHGWRTESQILAFPDGTIKFDVPFIPTLAGSYA